MSDSPDAIRANIEKTRNEFGEDVDALADKVSPSKIVHRQTNKMKTALHSVRERVMGAADDVEDTVKDMSGSVTSGIGDVTHRAAAKAEGNPLAVGLMAFGAGLLLASLIPASEKEKQIAEDIKEEAQPLMDEAAEVAKNMGEELKEPAEEAVETVKASVGKAASHIKSDATDATETVTDSARDARDNVAGS